MNRIHHYFKLYLSLLTVTIIASLPLPCLSQSISDPLPAFNKVVTGPLVNLVLQKGEEEGIRIEYEGIAQEKINYYVKGRRLWIFLDDARITVPSEEVVEDGQFRKKPVYRGVKVTAYVTFRNLKNLQIRGEETVVCKDSLLSKRFKIQLFGESHVDLAYLVSKRLKVKLFGENTLKIRAGEAGIQQYRLFGENKVSTEGMWAGSISTMFVGENRLVFYATEGIKFGVLEN